MKILHISSAKVTYPGGTEKVIWELARRQVKKDDVTILQTNLYEENESFLNEEKREGVKILTEKNDFFMGGLGYSKSFKKRLKEIYKQFDIVHIHGHGRFTSVYSMNFLKNKKPFIYSAQGFFHSKKNSLFKKTYDFLFKGLLKKASFCTALTPVEKKTLIEMGVPKNKIKVIPGGVDLKKFRIKKDLKRIREKYLGKKLKEKFVLLQVSRVHKGKGIQNVINSIENLDVVFLVAGKDSGYLSELKKKVKSKRMENKVKFLGRVSDEELLDIYKIANLFVLYSEWEGFGIVIIEAMANECPVIGSNKGSLPLVIKNNKTGFIVNNEKELENKIEILSNDKELVKKMGRNAKDFSQEFDWDNINKKELEMYLEAIKDFNGK